MKNDTPLATARDVLLTLSLLSRLPLPAQSDWSRQAQAAWAYPLAGLAVATLASFLGLLAYGVGLPPALVALITLAALIMMTGAMHEDGLADVADGFWGGWTVERRLEIMKDSRIGTYGMIALCLSLAARWAALWTLWSAGAALAIPVLIATAMLSRAAMPVVMHVLPHARRTGLSHSVGQVPQRAVMLGGAVAMGAALLLLGISALWAVALGGAMLAAMIALARRKIGGQTGDVLGATQQLVEITVLLTLLP